MEIFEENMEKFADNEENSLKVKIWHANHLYAWHSLYEQSQLTAHQRLTFAIFVHNFHQTFPWREKKDNNSIGNATVDLCFSWQWNEDRWTFWLLFPTCCKTISHLYIVKLSHFYCQSNSMDSFTLFIALHANIIERVRIQYKKLRMMTSPSLCSQLWCWWKSISMKRRQENFPHLFLLFPTANVREISYIFIEYCAECWSLWLWKCDSLIEFEGRKKMSRENVTNVWELWGWVVENHRIAFC